MYSLRAFSHAAELIMLEKCVNCWLKVSACGTDMHWRKYYSLVKGTATLYNN